MASIQISFYGEESYAEVYTSLARVFPPRSSEDGNTTWVAVPLDAKTSLTFFAPDTPTFTDEDDEVEA